MEQQDTVRVLAYFRCESCGECETEIELFIPLSKFEDTDIADLALDELRREGDLEWNEFSDEWLCPKCTEEVEDSIRDREETERELMNWGRI